MTVADSISHYVDREFEREVAFLAELVKVPSDNPPGDCAAHATRAGALLEALGFKVEADIVPPAVVAAAGMKSATNLIVRHRFGDGPTIALNAHGDVVPPGRGWTRDPYGAVIEDGPHGQAMYGRGAAVSKSDFATYTFAAAGADRCGGERRQAGRHGRAASSPTMRRSGGDIGPKRLLDAGLSRPDYVIAAGFSYSIVNAHNGCLHLEVIVEGKQAHAAIPDSGVDALEAANAILAALYASRQSLTKTRSATPGIVVADPQRRPDQWRHQHQRGAGPGHLPARPADHPGGIRGRGRGRPAQADRRQRQIVCGHQGRRCGRCCSRRRWFRSRAPSGSRRRSSATRKAILNTDVPVTGVPLYTDARHYAAHGIPVVLYGAGPRTILEANAHNANENIRLSDLRAATKIVALTVAALCGA